jgi:HEPN domain-containing protein
VSELEQHVGRSQVDRQPMNQQQFLEIDPFYVKANSVIDEARDHAKKFEYDLCVRRSQEAFELYLKTMFKLIEKEYPRKHDVGEEIYQVYNALKKYGFSTQKVAQLVHRNHTLSQWREKAFYGDDELNVGSIFVDEESKAALLYAEGMSIDCSSVRAQIWTEIVERAK